MVQTRVREPFNAGSWLTKGGVVVDYQNEWFPYKELWSDYEELLAEDDKGATERELIQEYKTKVFTPIKHYEEYLRKRQADRWRQVLARSNKRTVREIDALVDLYNEGIEKGEMNKDKFIELYLAVLKVMGV